MHQMYMLQDKCVQCQINKAVAAHEQVSKQLAATEKSLAERSQQLGETTAALEAKQADFSRLSQQHEALILLHERTQGELSDMRAVLKEKQKEAEGLQARCVLHSSSPVLMH